MALADDALVVGGWRLLVGLVVGGWWLIGDWWLGIGDVGPWLDVGDGRRRPGAGRPAAFDDWSKDTVQDTFYNL
jgi:hypothetical protein